MYKKKQQSDFLISSTFMCKIIMFLNIFLAWLLLKSAMALSLQGLSGVPETRKNIPNIGGSVVRLGDLYDGRKDMVLLFNLSLIAN